MSKPWKSRVLILDVSSLAHRAWHVLEQIQFNGQPTGVLYGVLRDLGMFQELFQTSKIVFCFDHPKQHRKEFYPEYKANRIREGRQSLYSQIDQLRTELLPEIGFKSIRYTEGFEADDWIAQLTKYDLKEHEIIIVTRDSDLKQLLRKSGRVLLYDPQTKSCYGYNEFKKEFPSIEPQALSSLMSITGCKTDNIEGIKGIGPVTAMKYLNKEALPEITIQKITDAATLIKRNVFLVTLPWSGLPIRGGVVLPNDKVSQEKWTLVCRRHGMESLVGKCPMWN